MSLHKSKYRAEDSRVGREWKLENDVGGENSLHKIAGERATPAKLSTNQNIYPKQHFPVSMP